MIPKRPARMTRAILEYASGLDAFTPSGFRENARDKWGQSANVRITGMAKAGLLEQISHGNRLVESRFKITEAGRDRLEELRKDKR